MQLIIASNINLNINMLIHLKPKINSNFGKAFIEQFF